MRERKKVRVKQRKKRDKGEDNIKKDKTNRL